MCFIVLLFSLFEMESWTRKTNQLGESSLNFFFVVVNLDPIILEKKWIDGESWPNDFVEKVNRGEELRWVGSRCPLMRALNHQHLFIFTLLTPSKFCSPSMTARHSGSSVLVMIPLTRTRSSWLVRVILVFQDLSTKFGLSSGFSIANLILVSIS